MEKKNIGQNVFTYPMPVTLVGSIVNNKPNFMAVGWGGYRGLMPLHQCWRSA
ncbi:MAG: hypothetical protein MUO26_09645 [Methanotrichaceae archaeon]|nr:hypothetical protein [Methanotrichaceae archaeon]